MNQRLKFLFTTWEGGGNVTPVLVVTRKLIARGHRVRVMSEECNRPEAEAAGARFTAWKRAPNRADRSRESQAYADWAAPTPQDALIGVIRDLWCGPSPLQSGDVKQRAASARCGTVHPGDRPPTATTRPRGPPR